MASASATVLHPSRYATVAIHLHMEHILTGNQILTSNDITQPVIQFLTSNLYKVCYCVRICAELPF